MNYMKCITKFGRTFLHPKNIIFLSILCLFSAFMYVYAFNVKNRNFVFKDVIYIPLQPNVSFEQPMPYKDFVMTEFSLRFGTHRRKNNGELSVSLYDNDELLDNWVVPTESLIDNGLKVFKLKKSVQMEKEHNYLLKLMVNYLDTDNIALYISKTPGLHFVYNDTNYEGIAEFQYGGYTKKQLYEIISLIAALVVLYVLTLFGVNQKFTACLVFFALGLTYVFIFPNGEAPDEREHFYRAYEIAEGNVVSQKIEESKQVGNYLPKTLSIFRDKSATISDERTFESFANTALYFPFSYIPQALGIKIASLFTDNVSKIFTCFVRSGIAFYAICKKFAICNIDVSNDTGGVGVFVF